MSINGYKGYFLSFSVIFLAWAILVHEAFLSAAEIWVGNEIYNHCLIVIPASIYLIYERRYELDWTKLKISWLAVFFFFGELVFFTLASAADIQLFQHVAIFSMLPTLVWIFIGNSLAWKLRFPLFFVLFSVPVGEELIPFLQEITADLSVLLLDATGIPLFRSGLFIEIPQGKFLVAEACSGVSFLIASIVLGSLYANMNLISWQRRTVFVMLSILFPIAANAVRVYGIIYIGYSTDMEHAVGADHLIYGWFFFAFVLVCLFLIGEAIRRNEIKRRARAITEEDTPIKSIKKYHLPKDLSLPISIFVVVLGLLALTYTQIIRMNTVTAKTEKQVTLDSLGLNRLVEAPTNSRVLWQPKYVGNNGEQLFSLKFNNANLALYVAYFDGSDGQLVSSLHRLYNQDRWTLVDRQRMSVSGTPIIHELITSSVGIKKQILYWYVVNGAVENTLREVKIKQLFNKLQGKTSDTYIVAAAIDVEQNEKVLRGELKDFSIEVLNSLEIVGSYSESK